MELPSDIFNNLEEATVEGWLKWDRFRSYSRFFDFGNTWRAIEIGNLQVTNTLYFSLGRPPFTRGIRAGADGARTDPDERMVPHCIGDRLGRLAFVFQWSVGDQG